MENIFPCQTPSYLINTGVTYEKKALDALFHVVYYKH
jgi:hypothetical protein